MRKALPALFILLAILGCDEKKKELVATVVGDAAPATPVVSATPPRDAGPAAVSSTAVPMPERPVPKPETMVGAGAPPETQVKAIAYMVAMRAPRPDEAAADEKYATELVTKLKPVLLSLDKGADKAKWNRVEMIAQGRQIDLMMSEGCDAKTGFNAVVQRLNVPLATLLSHGVLVLRCNDTKHQCLQSTRDQEDVLCTTAPRHR